MTKKAVVGCVAKKTAVAGYVDVLYRKRRWLGVWGCCIEKAVAGCVGVLYRKRRWLGVWVCCIENGGGWGCGGVV